MKQMTVKIGEEVNFKIVTTGRKVLECKGIVNGRVIDRGGEKFIINAWSVIEPKEINVRRVIPKKD